MEKEVDSDVAVILVEIADYNLAPLKNGRNFRASYKLGIKTIHLIRLAITIKSGILSTHCHREILCSAITYQNMISLPYVKKVFQED